MAGDAGLVYTQAEFNELIGGIARDVNVVMNRIKDVKIYLDQHTAGALDTLYSYTAGEGAEIKSAYADLDELRTVYEGLATLAVAKDFRTFAKRLYGLGF